MSKPKVYVARIATGWADGGSGWNYFSEKNKALLAEFSTPVIDASGAKVPGEEELIERLSGVRAILEGNGLCGEDMTERVLKAVGTVEVVVTAHTRWGGKLFEAAEKLGIKTAEGSSVIDMAVAEWTIATAIMGRRNLVAAGHSLKEEGFWQKDWRKASLLLGSRVGLVGFGHIGRIVAGYFKALGCEVVAYDKYFAKEKARALGVELVGLEELLKTSDVVSLHLPVTKETTGLLGAKEFALLKDGATFVNSARAALYDETALVKELRTGRFQALFDVYPAEERMNDGHGRINREHPFYQAVHTLDNVYMSSHIAGTNDVMYERAGTEAIETLRLYFEGKGLRDFRNS